MMEKLGSLLRKSTNTQTTMLKLMTWTPQSWSSMKILLSTITSDQHVCQKMIIQVMRAKLVSSFSPAAARLLTDIFPHAAIVSGWGARYHKGPREGQYPPILQETQVEVISNSNCMLPEANYHQGRITENMMCAYTPGTDSCSGDSGGPLVTG